MPIAASVLVLWFVLSAAPTTVQAVTGAVSAVPGILVDGEDRSPPFERVLRRTTRDGMKSVRRWFRISVRVVAHSLRTWWKWLRRAGKFVFLALLCALFDRKLIAAWRTRGLQALSTYVPLMLYSYFYLLLDRRTPKLGKLLLAASIGYGLVRYDLMPDRHLLPGLLDDTLIIAAATWLFLSGCPAKVVEQAANRAVAWRRRAQALRRAARPKT